MFLYKLLTKLLIAETYPFSGLALPHGLTLDEAEDLLCVADRESRRVLCYTAGIRWPKHRGVPVREIAEVHGRRVFDVASLGK